MASVSWKETVPIAVEPETWKGGDTPNLSISQILAPTPTDTMHTTWTESAEADSDFEEVEN